MICCTKIGAIEHSRTPEGFEMYKVSLGFSAKTPCVVEYWCLVIARAPYR